MGRAEWDALAWWEQRLYLEGLRDEFSDEPSRGSGGSDPDLHVMSGQAGEFRQMGLKERWL